MKHQIFGLVVIVLLLVIGTNNSFAQNTEIQPRDQKASLGQKKIDKKSRHVRQLDVWKERLTLTGEQMTVLEADLDKYVAEVQKLKENMDLPANEKKMAAMELRKAYEVKFKSHLTEEQIAKYESIRGTREQLKAKSQTK